MRAMGLLAVLGLALTGWLYWSSPDVDFVGPGDRDEVTLACTSLGDLYPENNTNRNPRSVVTYEQGQYVSEFLAEGSGDEGIVDPEREAELEASVAAACDEARTNRQTQLGLVAVITGVLAVVFFILVRDRGRRPEDEVVRGRPPD